MSDPPSLRATTRSGGRWSLASSTTQQVATIGATVVLARALSRQDFGVAALAQTVVFFLYNLTEAGFGASLVVREEVDERVASSLFWAAVLAGTGGAVLCVAVAWPVAAALGNASAGPYVAVAATLLVTGMGQSVVRGLLARELRFRAIAVAEMVGVVAYAVTQLVGALVLDLGAWSIVGGWVVMGVVTLVAMMAAGRWRPTAAFDVRLVREDLRFNAGYLGAGVASYGAKNLDNWAVSRWLGPAPLGGYYVAYVLPNIIRQRLTWIGNQVVFPVMRRLEGRSEVGRAFVDVVELITFVAVPLLVGLAVVAEPLLDVFFGAKWTFVSDPVRLLALAAALDTVAALAVPVAFAGARSGLAMRANVVRLAVLAVGLGVVGVVGPGLLAVSVAVLVSTAVGLAVSLAAVHHLTGVGAARVAATVGPWCVAAAAMAAVAVAVGRSFGEDAASWVVLAGQVGAGAAVYAAVAAVVFRSAFARAAGEAVRIVTGR